eukprot:3940000-Rhodomonas_salina.1
MSFSKEQYVEVISTYFHPKFQCYPTDTELNCQWADLGDQDSAKIWNGLGYGSRIRGAEIRVGVLDGRG